MILKMAASEIGEDMILKMAVLEIGG